MGTNLASKSEFEPASLRFGEVEIREAPGKGRGVFALRQFAIGELVMVGRAVELVSERTIYSVQIDWDRHVHFDQPSVMSNHSCDPNCGLRANDHDGYDFIALRLIESGEEITWDYCMSECEVIHIDACYCGAANCRKTLNGYSDLTEERRAVYAGLCADYLDKPPLA